MCLSYNSAAGSSPRKQTGANMIIFGALFIAIGVAALAGLSIWPAVLIGLGAGMIGEYFASVRVRPRRRERQQDESKHLPTASPETSAPSSPQPP